MPTTLVVPIQPIWDCRWSVPGYRLTGVSESLQPESLWVCVRTNQRRNVCEEECQCCPWWEALPPPDERN